MTIKILSDSTCDLPKSLLEEYNITLAPLTVVKGDEQFRDGVTIRSRDIFDHVAAGGELCSTAAVSIGEYQELFEQHTGSCDCLLHINLGSGFSSCHQNACAAAEDFPQVRCVDSRNLTVGQGLIVLEACRLSRETDDPDAIAERLDAYARRIETSFLVEKLDFLVKGGRCSSAAALGANLLNLKPCIELKEGKLILGKKYRGSFAKCLAAYVRDRLEGREDIDRSIAFLVHAEADPEVRNQVRDILLSYGFARVVEADTGSTISCHCGPGTLGVVFARKE